MERKMRRRGGRQKARAWMSRTRGKGRRVTWGEKEEEGEICNGKGGGKKEEGPGREEGAENGNGEGGDRMRRMRK